MIIRKPVLFGGVILVSSAVGFWAWSIIGTTHQQYAGQQSRSVKALSNEQVEGLKAGAGLGYAKSAELSGWPGPLHILELADELSLSAEQRLRVEELRQEMLAKAKPLGIKLISAEQSLDRVFAQTDPKAEDVEKAAQQVASIEAELRAVHLTTHLLSAPLLTDEQKAIYQRERGYAGHTGH